MKQKIFYMLLIMAIIFICFGYGMFYYYSPPKEYEPYPIPHNDDDTIRVAYLGDSWAFFHQPYDEKTTDSLSKKLNHPAKVTSFGYCGQTSKEIYKYVYKKYHMKCFLSKGYDYCFITVGINDSNKKMSTNYYKKSMEYIINFMLANHITPIILEIPNYDIEKTYRCEIPSRKPLRRLSRLITGTPINCKKEFRKALDDLLADKKYRDSVYVIRYMAWNSNYTEDIKTLYKDDGIHVNEKGYAKLDSCIIETCLKDYQTKHGKN